MGTGIPLNQQHYVGSGDEAGGGAAIAMRVMDQQPLSISQTMLRQVSGESSYTNSEDNMAASKSISSVVTKGIFWYREASSNSRSPSPPMSSNCSPTSSFSEDRQKLERLLGEPHRTMMFDGSYVEGDSFYVVESDVVENRFNSSRHNSASLTEACCLKNLDTGEVRNLLGKSSSRSSTWYNKGITRSFMGGTSVDPGKHLPQKQVAWLGWWKELRSRNDEFLQSALKGDVQAARKILEDNDCSLPALRIDGPSLHGRTALHLASSCGAVELVNLLLQHRADIHARSDCSFTPLHVACQSGHLECVRVLLAAGALVTTQTDRGELPLHLAAAKGHDAIVSCLLNSSASDEQRSTRNSYGQCAAEVSVDLKTAALLAKPASAALRTDVTCCVDRYAGRTAYWLGGVVLRDSRADHVRRLLQWTGACTHGPRELRKGGGLEAESGVASPPPDNTTAGVVARSLSHRQVTKSGKLPHSLMPSPSTGLQQGQHRMRQRKTSAFRSDGVEAVGPDSFQLKTVLGRGSFGEVYHVVHKKTGVSYAMKVLKKSKIMGRNLIRYAVTERNLLSYIRHPFIVRLHFAFQTTTCLVLVLQYCSNGNLAKLISKELKLQEPLAQLYTAELLLAIEHLHERQVVYRDLKPDNVVLDDYGHAMLTDFGLSKEGVEGPAGTRSFCGSVAYLAPEILARIGHGPPVDLYGVGVLLYEMLVGHPPFYSRDRDKLFRNIASAPLHPPSHASPSASSLICALMQRDPAKRLGTSNSSDVRRHDFFATIDFDAVLRREVRVPLNRFADKGGCAPPVDTKAPPGVAGQGAGKVQSPFGFLPERWEAQVRRMSSGGGSNDFLGWEFSTPTGAEDTILGTSPSAASSPHWAPRSPMALPKCQAAGINNMLSPLLSAWRLDTRQ